MKKTFFSTFCVAEGGLEQPGEEAGRGGQEAPGTDIQPIRI